MVNNILLMQKKGSHDDYEATWACRVETNIKQRAHKICGNTLFYFLGILYNGVLVVDKCTYIFLLDSLSSRIK